MSGLNADIAARFMTLTLGHLGREYPHKLDHVLDGPVDAQTPAALHPIFHGSFDWHSCVHGWWQVLRLARLYPQAAEAAEVRARADALLTKFNFAAEIAYLARPSARGFERPYGWAWALALHGEMVLADAAWSHHADQFAAVFAHRFTQFLPLQTYPIRTGTHFNSAFALVLALDWARSRDPALTELIKRTARGWFLADRACQAWEPGGDEFLSPALCEALLMSKVLSGDFTDWFDGFLPHCDQEKPPALFIPVHVADRSDGKIAHLDGLNLSRAWCWRQLAQALGPAHSAAGIAERAAVQHLAAGLPHISGDYMGEHWLATFALLAVEGAGTGPYGLAAIDCCAHR